ncbi:MDR family MFS transporter [Burkholderia cenocepacia]|uniref:MDR family MFS transporter n=1 Tax=Burkholderia cenocepacia TaxID=95486 RepID=UPI0023B89FAB|nr:MDR family MFS transporter [Burkholderia cenocepacia]MDF0504655.1 MDR family MFS transporter [Burkholderia cenocepacia]
MFTRSLLRTHRTVTTIAVVLSLFMATMETTIIATAMPSVVADLGGIDLFGWVSAIYLLGSTVTIPVYGKLADVYGRKPLVLFAISVFLAGSMASGLSRSMWQLIASRGLQALGAGGLLTLSFTVVGDIYTARERARVQSVFGAVQATAAISGPLIGGLLVKYLSWRWVFYVNVPFGVIAMVLYAMAYRESFERRTMQLDIKGVLLQTGAASALLLGMGQYHPGAMIPLALVFSAAFIGVERSAVDPVMSLKLLHRPVIGFGCILACAVGATMQSAVAYLPLYLQGVLKLGPTVAGTAVAPMLLGWPLALALSGRLLGRMTYRGLMGLGWMLAASATFLVATEVKLLAGPVFLQGSMFLLGLGLGFANTPIVLSIQESVTREERGVATASSAFFRTLGGATAVGTLGGIMAAQLEGVTDHRLMSEILGPDHGHQLGAAIQGQLMTHLEGSLVVIFYVVATFVAAAFILSLFFPALRLGQTEALRNATQASLERRGSATSS